MSTKNLQHIYLEIDGAQYYDYSGMMESSPYYINQIKNESDPVANLALLHKFNKDNIESLLDNNFSLSRGSKIHIVPDCKYNIADIRNNYKIARDYDTGVCNVYSPLDIYSRRLTFDNVVIIPFLKKVLFLDGYKSVSAIDDKVAGLFGARYDRIILDRITIVSSSKLSRYIPLLTGAHNNPCISYKKLEFDLNELTLDTLMLAYKAGNVFHRIGDSIEQSKLQLAILNQHNWREYPRTLRYFYLLLQYESAMREIFSRPSAYPKYIQEMYNVIRGNPPFASEKDFYMARSFVAEVLDIKQDKMFVSTTDFYIKSNKSFMTTSDFSELFDSIVRVTPKQYEQE